MAYNSRKKQFKSLFLHIKICNPFVFNPYGFYSRSNSILLLQDFYICSFSSLLLDYNKFESCRKVATRILKRQKPKGFFFPCFRFSLPYTRKSKNARMGKGKGGFSKFTHRLNSFSPLFFLHNVSLICATRVLIEIKYKLPISLCLLSIKSLVENSFFSFVDENFLFFRGFSFSESEKVCIRNDYS